MPQITPFPGWRYDPGKADYAAVTLPPYDMVSPETQKALYKRNDRNAVRLLCGREFAGDNAFDNRYSRAAAHLQSWRSEGLFLQDKPAVYVYQQEFTLEQQKFTRRGIIARVLLSEWGAGGIFPHAGTVAVTKADRLKLIRATRANLEPVLGLLTDPSGDISRSLYEKCQYAPVADFCDGDDVRHQFWVWDDSEQAPAFCAGCGQEQIIVAAGHHLYEAALSYRNEVREALKKAGQTPPPLGELPEDYVMMHIVPDSDAGLVILPMHRLLAGVAEVENLPARLADGFLVEKCASDTELMRRMRVGTMPTSGLVIKGERFLLTLKDWEIMSRRAENIAAEARGLDVSVLHALVLKNLLEGGENPSGEQKKLRYTPNWHAAVEMVENGTDGVQAAFLLRPATMAQVRSCGRAGAVMPPRSTCFFPQALAGMVFNFFW